MKNIVQRHVLLGLIALGAFTNSFALGSNTYKQYTFQPLSWRDQSIIDDITEKYDLGKRGDYKGYIVPIYDNTASIDSNKKIFADGVWLKNASKKEKEFVFGHELGHHKTWPSRLERALQNMQAWGKIAIVVGTTTAIGAYIGRMVGANKDKQNKEKQAAQAQSIDAPEEKNDDNGYNNTYRYGDIGGMIGMWMGCALYIRCVLPHHIESFSQKIEYDADKVSVEKLGCYKAAIDFFGAPYKAIKEARNRAEKNGTQRLCSDDLYPCEKSLLEYLMPKIHTHPADKDRIAHIKELQAHAQRA